MIENVTIVGVGRVGSALVQALGFKLQALGVKHSEVNEWLRSLKPKASSLENALSLKPEAYSLKHIIVLAVPAHAIAVLVSQLSSKDLNGCLVIHTNGSITVDILDPLRACGATTAAAHPFQTFADSDPSALQGIAWGVQCAEDAWDDVSEFVEATGGNPIHLGNITAEQKRLYHASAVAASNFTYAAYDLARKIAAQAGIDESTFLVPIMERTLHNAVTSIEKNSAFGITGPLARGDEKAVMDQLNSLPSDLRRAYAACSLGLLEGLTMEAETKNRLRNILLSEYK